MMEESQLILMAQGTHGARMRGLASDLLPLARKLKKLGKFAVMLEAACGKKKKPKGK